MFRAVSFLPHRRPPTPPSSILCSAARSRRGARAARTGGADAHGARRFHDDSLAPSASPRAVRGAAPHAPVNPQGLPAPAVRVALTGRPARAGTGHGSDEPQAPGPRAKPRPCPARVRELEARHRVAEEAHVATVQVLQGREAAVGQPAVHVRHHRPRHSRPAAGVPGAAGACTQPSEEGW